jgi:hypothetical protein
LKTVAIPYTYGSSRGDGGGEGGEGGGGGGEGGEGGDTSKTYLLSRTLLLLFLL